MLKEDVLIGAIVIYRQEVRPFTEKQIGLVANFAAQAVIAIENARLLNELRESLDRQTATADILRVIASTPEDSKRALDTIAETAARIFTASNVNFRRIEGNVLRMIGAAGPAATRVRELLPDFPLEPTDPAVRSVFENRQIAIEDRRATLPNERGEIARVLRDLPIRSQSFTPLSREGKAIGLMAVTRTEVRPFQQDELDLMKGFADQAVIAIENARLLSELRESLDRQTATAEVLRVISSSPGELEPVFQNLLENATRICDAKFGTLFRFDGDMYHLAASFGTPPDLVAFQRQRGPFRPPPDLDEITRTKRIRHTADAAADPNPGKAATLGGARSAVYVPMLKDDLSPGGSALHRQADCAGPEFRRSSRHRHREHAVAQRIAPVVAAANRDLRCTQDH
jgi:hypothetical protein